jgi:hypothetical protein
MKNLISLFVSVVLLIQISFAQTLVKVQVGDQQVDADQVTCAPITMDSFTNMYSFQFCLRLQDSIAQVTAVTDLGLGMLEQNYNIIGNMVCVSWFAPTIDPVNISNDSVIFRICYKGISINCDSSDLVIPVGEPTPPEFLNELSANPTNVFDFNHLVVGSLAVSCVSSTQEPVVRAAISPNPTHDRFTIQTEVNWTKATIYDGFGRVVVVLPTWMQEVDLSPYSAGLYTIVLEQMDGRIALGRVVKL